MLKAVLNSKLSIKFIVFDTCRYFSIKKRQIADASSFEYNISTIPKSVKAQSSKNPESSSEDGTSVFDSRKIKLPI